MRLTSPSAASVVVTVRSPVVAFAKMVPVAASDVRLLAVMPVWPVSVISACELAVPSMIEPACAVAVSVPLVAKLSVRSSPLLAVS